MSVKWTPAKIAQFKEDVVADIRRRKPMIPEGWRWVMHMEWFGYDGAQIEQLVSEDNLRMPEPGFWIRRKVSDDES